MSFLIDVEGRRRNPHNEKISKESKKNSKNKRFFSYYVGANLQTHAPPTRNYQETIK